MKSIEPNNCAPFFSSFSAELFGYDDQVRNYDTSSKTFINNLYGKPSSFYGKVAVISTSFVIKCSKIKNKEHCTRVDFYKRIDGLFGKFYYRRKSIQDIYVRNCENEYTKSQLHFSVEEFTYTFGSIIVKVIQEP